MASKSKVNVRFVVTLSIVLGGLFIGVATTAFFVLTHSASELESMGDQAMKDKAFKDAITYYGKAFADDQANVPRLKKYCDAMLAYTPENQALYGDYYWKRYIPAKRMLATLLKDDVSQQKELLDILSRNMYQSGFERHGWDQVIDIANNAIASFQAGSSAPGWQVLKRYRGLGWLEIAMNDPTVDESLLQNIEPDLKEVAALDPNDEDVALGLVNWYNFNASKAADAEHTTDEAEWRAKSQSALDAYRAAHPDSVLAAITAVATKIEAASRAADPKKYSPEQRLKMMKDAAARLQPDVAAVIELIRRVGPDKVDSNTLYRVDRLELFAYDKKDDQTRALVARAIELAPGKGDLLYMAGRMAEDTRNYEEAIKQYEAVIALPIPPLSLDGIMLYSERLSAMSRQCEAQMGIWDSMNDKPDQKAEQARALEKVRDVYRKRFALEVPDDNLELLLIDAKLDFASDKLTDAQVKLQSHLRQTNQSDPDSVRLAGIVALRLNQPGIARDLFTRLIELQPTNPAAKKYLASTLGMLEDHKGALAAYREVLALNPEDAEAREKVDQLVQLISGTSDNPITQAMLEANALWTGAPLVQPRKDAVAALEKSFGQFPPGVEAGLINANSGAPDRDLAIALLEIVAAKAPKEVKPLQMLTTYYYNVGRVDDAKAKCNQGLALAPDNPELKNLALILQYKDQYEAGKALIDASPSSPVEKAIAKLQLAKRYGKTEEAQKFLADAVALSPDAPAVIEYRFTDAIAKNDLVEASKLAEQATALDLDRLKGASYKARLLVAQKQKAAAIEVLKGAAQGGQATPEVWRFLGQVQSDLGQETNNSHLIDDALVSLNESLRMRPNDLGAVLDTLKTLVHLNRYDVALDLARKNEALGRGNAEFVDLWLRLEASVGNKTTVLARRRVMLKDQPKNNINKVALLQSDVDVAGPDSGFDANVRNYAGAEARALIDDLRAQPDQASNALLLTQLDARLHADQGDRDGARKVYLDFIAAQKAAGAANTPEPYVAMAQFLVGIGDTEGGIDALHEAQKYQDPKTLQVDRTLGMMLFDLGRLEDALPVLEGFLAAGAPDDLPSAYAVRARYTETLLRLKRYEDAEKSLDAAGAEANQTITLMLLRAGTRQGLKDDQGALKIINDAIVKYPNEPLGYVKRAELTSTSAESIDDAIADLDTAVRLKPDLWNALQLRALLKIRQNRQEEAMDDLKAVVKGNPASPGPRNALLQALIESNKFDEAVDIANIAANQRSRDVSLLMSLGDLFNSYVGQPVAPNALRIALRYYEQAWKVGPNPAVAIIYTRALLRNQGDQTSLELASQILTSRDLKVDQNPQLLMNYAVVLKRKEQFDNSRATAAQALKLVIKDPGDTSAMLDQLAPVFGDPYNNKNDRAALIEFVQNLDMSGLPDLWPDFFRARFKILDPQAQDEAIGRLRLVVQGSKDPTLQRVSRQFLSAALIGSGDNATRQGNAAVASSFYEEALQVIKGALTLDPDNAEALNNGAYVLVENLKRPEEALPMAEHAVQVMPEKGPFWDTLGLIYLELGRFDDADKALNRAASAGGGMNDRMQIGIKMIRVKIGKKDKAAAQKILDGANKATAADPGLKAAYQDQLDALQKEVDAIQ